MTLTIDADSYGLEHNGNKITFPTVSNKSAFETYFNALNPQDVSCKICALNNIWNQLQAEAYGSEKRYQFLKYVKTFLDHLIENTTLEKKLDSFDPNLYQEIRMYEEKVEIESIKIRRLGSSFIVEAIFLDTKPLPFDSSVAIAAIKYNSPPSMAPKVEKLIRYADPISSKIDDPKTRLIFLKEVVFTLIETGRKFIDRPNHLENLIYEYWTTFKNLAETEKCCRQCKLWWPFRRTIEPKAKTTGNGLTVDLDIAVDACTRFLDLCESDSNQEWFERKRPAGSGGAAELQNTAKISGFATREDCMIELANLLQGLEKNPVITTTSEKNTATDHRKIIHQSLRRIKRWLLLRYNIREAWKIEFSDTFFQKISFLYLPEAIAIIFIIILLTPLLLGHFSGQPRFLKEGINLFNRIISPNFTWFLMVGGACLFLTVWSPFHLKKKDAAYPIKKDTQLHLPRLAAGILVGYLVLMNDESWGAIFSLNSTLESVGRIFIPLAAVFLYILIEMNNVTGMSSKPSILRKAFRLLRRGWAYSILIGIMVSDLFGKKMVERFLDKQVDWNSVCTPYMQAAGAQATLEPGVAGKGIICFPGVLGFIYPEVILYLAPLALFIGVFVQLLWQDKSLTEKI